MEKVATDIYTFSELRRGDFAYVDKTGFLREMACGESGRHFFIARPRRFGKSLAEPSDVARFLRVCEVMSVPPGGGDEGEYVVVTNTSDSVTLELAGISMSTARTTKGRLTERSIWICGVCSGAILRRRT